MLQRHAEVPRRLDVPVRQRDNLKMFPGEVSGYVARGREGSSTLKRQVNPSLRSDMLKIQVGEVREMYVFRRGVTALFFRSDEIVS